MDKTQVMLFDVNYEVSNTGAVKNLDDNVSPPISTYKDGGNNTIILFDNDIMVSLNYGLFMLFAFNKFFLPIELWDNVDVGFLDDDKTNYRFENLYPIYKNGPIPFELLEGFYYIPGYENNVINKKGLLYRIPQSDILFPVHETNEKYATTHYPHYRIFINTNNVMTRDVHRLLGLTFKNPPEKYPLHQVNHIDGKKDNYELDNLEWVTVSENNLHAFINDLRTDNKRIQIKDLENGEIRTYFSLGEAARALTCSVATLSSALIGVSRTYLKRYLVKELNDDTTWEELENAVTKSTIKPVKAKHVITGEIVNFSSVKEAARKLAIHSFTILKQVNSTKAPRSILAGYEFKRADDFSGWKTFSEYEIEVFQKGLPFNTAVYIVKNLTTGVEEKHFGWRSVSELTGAVKRTIIQVSKRSGVIGKIYKVTKVK